MIDDALIAGWLAARSIARDLPAPVAEAGGGCVDGGLSEEHRRYVFTASCDGLRAG